MPWLSLRLLAVGAGISKAFVRAVRGLVRPCRRRQAANKGCAMLAAGSFSGALAGDPRMRSLAPKRVQQPRSAAQGREPCSSGRVRLGTAQLPPRGLGLQLGC